MRLGAVEVGVGEDVVEQRLEPPGLVGARLDHRHLFGTLDLTRAMLRRPPWNDVCGLADFATSRGLRLVMGNDFARTALGFRLRHEPGGFYNHSPANAQLIAVILERATGLAYERYLEQRLWRPMDAGPGW